MDHGTGGIHKVELEGKDDKWQIIAVLAGTMNSNFLPIQLVYEGKITHCISQVNFPSNWDAMYLHMRIIGVMNLQ